MAHRSSFSQHNIFEQCKLAWYYKYVLKLEEKSDMSYAHGGTIVHKCLEKFYNNKNTPLNELKNYFNNMWEKYYLKNSIIANKKDNYWLMVLNGRDLDLPFTNLEYKISFPEAICYIDLMDKGNGVLVDWKSSTRSKENEEQYLKQLKFYSWMFYKEFNEIPKKLQVYYLKYSKNSLLEYEPKMSDIDEIRKWYNTILSEMDFIKTNNKKPMGTCNYHFCPFKENCEYRNSVFGLGDSFSDFVKIDNNDNTLNIQLSIKGNYIYIEGEIPKLLNIGIKRKFSFKLKNAYWIKKNNPRARTVVTFWNEKFKRLPLGFLSMLQKTINDYAEHKEKKLNLIINDERIFCKKKKNMPEKIIGKELRDYQKDAVDVFLNNKICMLELGTGAGKSLILAEAIRKTGYKTLIVVNRREILTQLKKVLGESLGMEIGELSGSDRIHKHITIGTIQTMSKLAPYDIQNTYNEFRMVIFDECHNINHFSYFNFSNYLANTEYRLGLSGTAFRSDGNDMYLNAVCGEIKYKYNANDLVDDGWLMKPKVIFIKDYMSEEEKNIMEERLDGGTINETNEYNEIYNMFIVENEFRNNFIIDLAEKSNKEKILILVKRISHGEELSKRLNCSYIQGNTPKKEREEVMDNFRNNKINLLIGTQSIFSEGIDIPELSVIINACGHKSDVKTIQMLGRVLRKNKNKTQCIFYDFLDDAPMLKHASINRFKTLKKEGHEVRIKTKDNIYQ